MKGKVLLFISRVLRKFYIKINGKKKKLFFNPNTPQYTSQKASDLIKNYIESESPCMIARFGSVELDCLFLYNEINKPKLNSIKKFIKGDIESLNWTKEIINKMEMNAGFFPSNPHNLSKFSDIMLNDIKNLDVLGSWLNKENSFKEELKHVKTVDLLDLEPYYHENPWSASLKNKKVLVIHPFVESIKSQYNKRELLFKNKDILPDFELITYKPVQSIACNYQQLNFKTWFDALEFMKSDIKTIDFDIAIIGCGAYGFPLASFIKDLGKKSIHLGGATQILFGIIGKRWEVEYDMSNFFNEHWVRPLKNEIPNNFNKVENGCYW